MGCTDSEFLAAPQAETKEALERLVRESYGSRAEEIIDCFKGCDTAEAIRKRGEISAILFAMLAAARVNDRKEKPDKFYSYVFSPEIPGWDNPGTFHSVDLWFFFETLAKCWRPFKGWHFDLARNMCDYWVNFIRTGDPNGEDSQGEKLPEWPALTAKKPEWMRFDRIVQAESCAENRLTGLLLDAYLERKGVN